MMSPLHGVKGNLIIVPIFKMDSGGKCANRRSINLIPMASKLVTSFILCRLHNTRDQQTREEQVGFRAARVCIDQNSTGRHLLERRFTFQNPAILVFVDISAVC